MKKVRELFDTMVITGASPLYNAKYVKCHGARIAVLLSFVVGIFIGWLI